MVGTPEHTTVTGGVVADAVTGDIMKNILQRKTGIITEIG